METKINEKGLAIFNTLKANEGKTLAFAEIAALAGIEPKTGFLTSAKKIALTNGYEIVKIEDAVTAKVATETAYPNGLIIKAEKTAIYDGYTLKAKAE